MILDHLIRLRETVQSTTYLTDGRQSALVPALKEANSGSVHRSHFAIVLTGHFRVSTTDLGRRGLSELENTIDR